MRKTVADLTLNYEYWKQNGIKSKLTGLIIAPEDYHEGDKYHFTWDDAIALKLPDGWRLPTRSEWVLICEEFGLGGDGTLNSNILMKNLNLELCDERALEDDDYFHFWSSTQSPSNPSSAFLLYFDGSGVFYPSYSTDKSYGFTVRCVRRTEKEKFNKTRCN